MLNAFKIRNRIKGIYDSIKNRLQKSTYDNRIVVLLYHRVADLTTDPQLLAVAPTNFNSHLEHLRKNYKVLTIEEFENVLIKRRKISGKAVVITFDDGYYDNYYEALPILERHSVQALFYICTGNLNTNKEFWWDELERILLLTENLPASLSLTIDNIKRPFDTSSTSARTKTYEELLPVIRRQNVSQRTEIIKYLEEWSGNKNPRSNYRSLTFEEFKKLSNSMSAIVGAHTHNHPSLATLKKEEQYFELNTSKEIIKEITGVEARHFSYPFGTESDFNEDSIQLCRLCGFDFVAANIPNPVNAKSNRLQFPRFLVRNWNEEMFMMKLEEFFSS